LINQASRMPRIMNQILQKATKHCLGLLLNSRCNSLPFHNAMHTLEVYENVIEIGTFENFNYEELEPILLAALFHDTGNAFAFNGHELFSINEADAFLRDQEYSVDKTALVMDCINSTRMPQNPISKSEKILCDSDLFHLGTKSFMSKNKLLRKEFEFFLNENYSERDWIQLNIEFLGQHQFHTTYGKEILKPIKQENIKNLKTYLNKLILA